jgi:hypothetical protein
MICMVFNSQAAELLPAMETPVPIYGQINASETLLLNSSIDSSISQVSFVLRWQDASNVLEMAMISPNGSIIDPSAMPPVIHTSEERTETYIVQDPEPGNWAARITAKNTSADGEKYTFLVIKIKGVQ